MSSRLLDNVYSSNNAELVHPRELGGKCKATASNWDEAQAVWWSKLSNCTRVGERQFPGARRGEYGMLLQVWQTSGGRRFMVVVDEQGEAPIQFWAIPQPEPTPTPESTEQPAETPATAPYVWPVNVIREAQDEAPATPAPVAGPTPTPAPQPASNSEWRFYLVR